MKNYITKVTVENLKIFFFLVLWCVLFCGLTFFSIAWPYLVSFLCRITMFASKTVFPLFAWKSNNCHRWTISGYQKRLGAAPKLTFKWLVAGQEQKVPVEKTAAESSSHSSCRDFCKINLTLETKDTLLFVKFLLLNSCPGLMERGMTLADTVCSSLEPSVWDTSQYENNITTCGSGRPDALDWCWWERPLSQSLIP